MNLSRSDLKELEQKSELLVRNCGKELVYFWNKKHTVTYKNIRDVVTEVDVKVENELREKLHKLLPEAGFIVEEGKTEKKKIYNWVIDPIDGTKNYVYGLPMFFTQIALLENGKPILGIVYNPVSNQMFSASLGSGSYLNDSRIVPPKREKLAESIIDIDFGGKTADLGWKTAIFSSFVQKFYRVRVAGGFLFIYLTTGAIDAYLGLDQGIKIVDIMPGKVILRECGIRVETVELSRNKQVLVAANSSLFAKVVRLLV